VVAENQRDDQAADWGVKESVEVPAPTWNAA